ncbi:MAG: amidohydrolase family protein [Pseudomonadota bacterium]
MARALGSDRATLLLTGGIVIPVAEPGERIIWPGSVAVLDGRIAAVGPAAEIDPAWPAATRIECAGRAVLPGLVNCHVHAAMNLLKGAAGDRPLPERLSRVVWPFLSAMDASACRAGSRLACLEMLKAGITTFADMWPHLPETAGAVAESGLRAVLATYHMDARGERLDEVLAAALPFKSARIGIAVGLQSLYTASAEVASEAAGLAQRHGLPIHLHALETEAEVEAGHDLHRADALGLMRAGTILAHAVWARPDEIRLIAARGAGVAHNPTSNAKLGVGVAPVAEMVAAGVAVGLGTDSAAANDRHDLFDEMRLALLLQRMNGPAGALTPAQALGFATREGARVVGLERRIGTLEVGKRADIITVDLSDARFRPLCRERPEQVLAHLVFAASGADVDTVIVEGRVLMRERVVETLDEAAVMAEGQAAAAVCLAAAELA